ncbi:MAG: acyltransferase [Bacteroidota bacterium]|nr:acyltransferase [Bacteroidota bacterium]MDP4247672.1 acyltransferase [Bacteroidota bacterium]MDP4260374.1 acyltransferase [Bacteroidota bacterium]
MPAIMNARVNPVSKILRNPFLVFYYLGRSFVWLITRLPYFRFIRDTQHSETAISFHTWYTQKVRRINYAAYWPMHPSSIVSYPKNVYAGINTCPGYNPGCYIHAVNGIYIGDYTQIGPNVGLMSGNHDLYDFRIQTEGGPIRIGKYCWIGMGAVILPEVELGDFTIVGAGAIVTKSFPEGHCVIAGNPAQKIRDLEREKAIPFSMDNPYNGYIPHDRFEEFRKRNLTI